MGGQPQAVQVGLTHRGTQQPILWSFVFILFSQQQTETQTKLSCHACNPIHKYVYWVIGMAGEWHKWTTVHSCQKAPTYWRAQLHRMAERCSNNSYLKLTLLNLCSAYSYMAEDTSLEIFNKESLIAMANRLKMLTIIMHLAHQRHFLF